MVKSVSAPVEFINVASALYISNQTAGSVSVGLRGKELRALRYSSCKSGGGFRTRDVQFGNLTRNLSNLVRKGRLLVPQPTHHARSDAITAS
jgi:hypothetical protein